jgi:hypothetical protein
MAVFVMGDARQSYVGRCDDDDCRDDDGHVRWSGRGRVVQLGYIRVGRGRLLDYNNQLVRNLLTKICIAMLCCATNVASLVKWW